MCHFKNYTSLNVLCVVFKMPCALNKKHCVGGLMKRIVKEEDVFCKPNIQMMGKIHNAKDGDPEEDGDYIVKIKNGDMVESDIIPYSVKDGWLIPYSRYDNEWCEVIEWADLPF